VQSFRRLLRGLLLALAASLPVCDLLAQPAGAPPTRGSKPPPAAPAGVEQRLLEATRRTPDDFAAHKALASFYLERGKLAAALPHLERAQAIDPRHYANGYDLALALLELGRLHEAREQVRRLIGLKQAGELHNLLGDIEERAGNLVLAAEEYQRAAHMDATEDHLFDWGNNLVQLRAFEPASRVFAAALERHPRSARLHVGLGIAHYSRGQYEEAVRSFCEASDLAPSDPRPYQFLGEMYGVAPELAPDISERLGRFVKARPRSALAHLYYGLSLWKGQRGNATDLRQVEALLRRAVTLDPKLAKGHLELGILLSDQQRDTEAIPALRRAAQLDPGQPQAHYRLAQAYRRTGQGALAASELQIFERLKAQSR
jgi:tetratricopeptide (TPR) repeat protein